MATFFNEFFGVTSDVVEEYGAFNVSLINDLPLFVDPFLLFHSNSSDYQELHKNILKYVVFLRDAVLDNRVNDGLLRAWFLFPEVKQNWLGLSLRGNGGTGLGPDFAKALYNGLKTIFRDFGHEKISRDSHLEKICLVRSGIGRDNISDFTVNLIKDFICKFTEEFALQHISADRCRVVGIAKAVFNYTTEAWESRKYTLPWFEGDYVLLTPVDLLTRDENWINRTDMIRDFESIPVSIKDAELRAQVSSYFERVLVRPRDRAPSQRERDEAAQQTIAQFPSLIDYFIRSKEDAGDQAEDLSAQKVGLTKFIFDTQIRSLQERLQSETAFYRTASSTYDETHQRLAYLKDVIEKKGGHKLFYHNGEAIQRENDLQILFRFVWLGSPSDVGAEANDGRGPVDYKISRGARDKTLVEMKLAKNSSLERNLEKQLSIYQAASDAKRGIKAIIYFSAAEQARVEGILDKLGILGHQDVVLIDARNDNKPSGSKA